VVEHLEAKKPARPAEELPREIQEYYGVRHDILGQVREVAGSPPVRLDRDAPMTLSGDGLPRRVEARCVSAPDGDIGSSVGEKGRDLRADAP
jgi:hypothetical protein